MTISSNRFTNTLLPVIFTVLAGFAACSSDDDGGGNGGTRGGGNKARERGYQRIR